MFGTSSEGAYIAPSNFKGCLKSRKDEGLKQVHFTTSFGVSPDNLDYIGDVFDGSVVPAQTAITKIRVTPATDFAVTIGGTEYTEEYADIEDHTTNGPLQLHMETLIGAEQPYLIFNRKTTTTLEIMAGDYCPGP